MAEKFEWKLKDTTPENIPKDLLRKNNYPIPIDCLKNKCPQQQPACQLGTCVIAVKICGDF